MASKPLVQMFTDDLIAVLEKYEDSGITLAESLGALELMKYDILQMAAEGGDDDEV